MTLIDIIQTITILVLINATWGTALRNKAMSFLRRLLPWFFKPLRDAPYGGDLTLKAGRGGLDKQGRRWPDGKVIILDGRGNRMAVFEGDRYPDTDWYYESRDSVLGASTSHSAPMSVLLAPPT